MTTPKHDEKKPEENGKLTSNPSAIPADIMDYLLKAFVLISVGFTDKVKEIFEYAYQNRQVTEDKKSGTIPVTTFHETEIGKLFKELVENSKKIVAADQIAKVDTSKGPELEALKEQTEEIWKKLVEAVGKDQTEKDAKEAGIKKPVIAASVKTKKHDDEPGPLNPPHDHDHLEEGAHDEHLEHGNGGHEPPHPPDQHAAASPPPPKRSIYPLLAVGIVALIIGMLLGANLFPTEIVKEDPRVAVLQKRLAKIGKAARVNVPASNFETEKGINKAADVIEKQVVTVVHWDMMPLPPTIDVPAENPEIGRIIVMKKDGTAPAPPTADSTTAVEDAGLKLPDLGLDDEDKKNGNAPAPVVVAESKKNDTSPNEERQATNEDRETIVIPPSEPNSQDSFCASGIRFTPVRNRGASGTTLYLVLPQRGLQGIPPWPVTCGREGLTPDFREDKNGSWALDCVQGEGGDRN